jgi:hypothetical protein
MMLEHAKDIVDLLALRMTRTRRDDERVSESKRTGTLTCVQEMRIQAVSRVHSSMWLKMKTDCQTKHCKTDNQHVTTFYNFGKIKPANADTEDVEVVESCRNKDLWLFLSR